MTDVRRQLEAYGEDTMPSFAHIRRDFARAAFKALEAVLNRHDFHMRAGNLDCRCNLCVAVRDISSALPDVRGEE